MSPLRLEIVTQERALFSGNVDMVVAPGLEGELGILPGHAPLLTALGIGPLLARRGSEELWFAIHGGFMEVTPEKVIVLADVAERAEEIDIARAEEARQRAEQLLKERPAGVDLNAALAALRRSRVRLEVARRRRIRRESSSGP